MQRGTKTEEQSETDLETERRREREWGGGGTDGLGGGLGGCTHGLNGKGGTFDVADTNPPKHAGALACAARWSRVP